MITLSDVPSFGFNSISIPGGRSWTLTTALGSLLLSAEALYGQRDNSWTILGAEFAQDREKPGVWFPGECRHISVMLTESARLDWRRACFQLSHEVIHLLSPNGGGPANNLEEGIAVLFSDQMSANNGWNFYTDDHYYLRVKVAAASLLSIDPHAVRRIRAEVPAFRDITPETLTRFVPACPRELAEELCRVGYP